MLKALGASLAHAVRAGAHVGAAGAHPGCGELISGGAGRAALPLLTALAGRLRFSTAAAGTATDPSQLRNVAIIAHVDHGKTTLVDKLLALCEGGSAAAAGAPSSAPAADRVMDSHELERERGITILSKPTALRFGGLVLNVVDTPGHADFGGEVERVLGMVDGAVLVVDACEGPMSQTKFVLRKALGRGLRPIVVLNKADRPAATATRLLEVESAVFDTFAALGASEEQLDFPVLHASARQGWAREGDGGGDESGGVSGGGGGGGGGGGMAPLLRRIAAHVPPPGGSAAAPFCMLVSMTERHPHLGLVATGRVAAGTVKVGDPLRALPRGGGPPRDGLRVTRLFKRFGVRTVEVPAAVAGDIVAIAGSSGAGVADTLAAPEVGAPLPPGRIDEPTLAMVFAPNSSPLAGRDGSLLTGAQIGARLAAEAEANPSLRVAPVAGGGGEAFEVVGRGEMQLALLIESMRREGFELSVGPPRVVMREGERGERLEPLEEVVAEVEDADAGALIQELSSRRGELLEAAPAAGAPGRTRLAFEAPSRGLVGLRAAFQELSRGTGTLARAFTGYGPHRGGLNRGRRGALVATAGGAATAHALGVLEARGALFVSPGDDVYEGMVVGESSREADLDVNPTRAAKLTNVRNTGSEERVTLAAPRPPTLEEAVGRVAADELIEVTPRAVRLRKRTLAAGMRKAERRREA